MSADDDELPLFVVKVSFYAPAGTSTNNIVMDAAVHDVLRGLGGLRDYSEMSTSPATADIQELQERAERGVAQVLKRGLPRRFRVRVEDV